MRKEDIYARMMHTPDDPARAELRAAIRETWKSLLPLHRALIDAASAEYSTTVAPVTGPTHLLQLLQDDAFFAWLKPLSMLIVDLDSMARTDFERADVDAMVKRVEGLFAAGSETPFGKRYVDLLQQNVDVAIAHAAMRQAVAKLG